MQTGVDSPPDISSLPAVGHESAANIAAQHFLKHQKIFEISIISTGTLLSAFGLQQAR